jgi:hypothetical protein
MCPGIFHPEFADLVLGFVEIALTSFAERFDVGGCYPRNVGILPILVVGAVRSVARVQFGDEAGADDVPVLGDLVNPTGFNICQCRISTSQSRLVRTSAC